MRTIRLILLTLTMLAGTLFATAGTADAAPAHRAISYYLSLGDSLAQGIQADPSTGVSIPTDEGYPDQLFKILRKSNPSLHLVKLGCPGETSTTMITGSPNPLCPYSRVSQLTAATRFLLAHRGHVTYLTINIGSSDALACATATAIDTACLAATIPTVGRNLSTILGTLRSALPGGRTAKAGMTYYDPFLAVFPTNPDLAVRSVVAIDALNAVESFQYLKNGFHVARVDRAFQTNNFTPVPPTQTPTNVARICSLTGMCRFGNVHPNSAGYAVIAKSFAGVLSCPRRR